MINIFESISKRLAEAWRSEESSGRGHKYRCQCGRAIFFRNSLCLGCKSALGYEPEVRRCGVTARTCARHLENARPGRKCAFVAAL